MCSTWIDRKVKLILDHDLQCQLPPDFVIIGCPSEERNSLRTNKDKFMLKIIGLNFIKSLNQNYSNKNGTNTKNTNVKLKKVLEN